MMDIPVALPSVYGMGKVNVCPVQYVTAKNMSPEFTANCSANLLQTINNTA